jgi:hypothetical protein
VPLELRPPDYDAHDDVELGWPRHRVAAYLEAQASLAEKLRAAGWKVFPIDRKLDLRALEEALGLTESES